MPRAAVLSVHARVQGTTPTVWEDPSLVQLWGPGYHAYVVAAKDLAVFSLGRLPDDEKSLRRAEDLAARLHDLLAGERVGDGQAGRALGSHPNSIRYAAPTGTVLIRWDGARRPTIWTVPKPAMAPRDARLELARRYLHIFGPTTSESFSGWAGIPREAASTAFEALARSLLPVRTPIGDGWMLARDESDLRSAVKPAAAARLLPSGDTYTLLYGTDRELLVPDAAHRSRLWTSRVWPGAVMVEGEIVGTWRRAQEKVTIPLWRRVSRAARDSVEAEAASLPLPGIQGQIVVHWE
jgi:hypothetical protein